MKETNGTDVSTTATITKATAVRISHETMERMKPYRKIYGTSYAFIVNRAINEWMDSVGDVRMEALQYHAKGDLSGVPVPAALQVDVTFPSEIYTNEDQVTDELAGLPVIDAAPTRDLSN